MSNRLTEGIARLRDWLVGWITWFPHTDKVDHAGNIHDRIDTGPAEVRVDRTRKLINNRKEQNEKMEV